jgi:superoxide dismutase, Fe-Mn family
MINAMKFELPLLTYDKSSLEPFISARTMDFHYNKHLQSYITNLNNLIAETKFKNSDLETIIKLSDGAIFNNAAQTWNHKFFFESLKSAGSNYLNGPFSRLIIDSFGSISFFKESFTKAAGSLFGSGWVWLVRNPKGSMEILQESNAGNPLRRGLMPLLACDVWEHAYYLDYQNRRVDYIEAYWNLVDWEVIEKRYIDSM